MLCLGTPSAFPETFADTRNLVAECVEEDVAVAGTALQLPSPLLSTGMARVG